MQTTGNLSELRPGNKMSQVNDQFHIQSLGRIQVNKYFQKDTPERLNLSEIIWVKNGQGTLTVDLEEYSIAENTIYCLAPGQFRLLQFASNIEGYYICLSPDFLYPIDSYVDLSFLVTRYNGGCNLPLGRPDVEMEDLIVRMQREYLYQDSLHFEILMGLLRV